MKNEATEHILLFRSNGWDRNLSPEEMQRVLDRTMAWFERLEAEGKMRTAQPLVEDGATLSGPGGRDVTDGPFAEAKESVAGYLILREGTFDEALAIARTWPMLECDARIEVRPIAAECPGHQRLREQMSDASA